MQNSTLSSLGMQEEVWNLYRTDDPYIHEKKHKIPHMVRLCFETIYNKKTVTLGVFRYNSVEVLKAWGYKDVEHCSYHAIKLNGEWSEVIEGCPDFTTIQDEQGGVIGFTISHKKVHIWERDSYREEELPANCCASKSEAKVCHVSNMDQPDVSMLKVFGLYTPLIATALFSFILGWVVTFLKTFSVEMFIMNSMGVFITTIGLLKMRDVAKFAQMFKRYDPIAKQFLLYAKVYPFLETTLGLLILASVFVVPTQIAVMVIYSVTTFGIVSSLRRKEKLECGCLGGEVKLPLSKITIFENTIMILMAACTIYSRTM